MFHLYIIFIIVDEKFKLKIMKILLFIISLLFVLSTDAQSLRLKTSYSDLKKGDHINNTVVFRIKPEYRDLCQQNNILHKDFESFEEKINITYLKRSFPDKEITNGEKDRFGNSFIDLSLIYKLEYSSKVHISYVIELLNSLSIIKYTEPLYMPESLFVPIDHDSLQGNQYYLNNIKAFDAWNIEKGDSNIVIGIIETGTDIYHPDLKNNIKYNYNDPIDGIDNDNDGFIDNFIGWDFGEDDNMPQDNNVWGHGIYVCGLSASTNNGIGVSGVGYNCKFLPIKVEDYYGNLIRTDEAIVYAADRGCDVINCSWGDTVNPSAYEQDIFNYASINKNVLVIASAGNADNETEYYPASYENVLSVGGTSVDDVKWQYSTYGINIDICAPSDSIWSTTGRNVNYYSGLPAGYDYSNGTSFASPIVAGCAAIVKSHFPNLSALQIAEQLKVTADYIDTILGNVNYSYKLGMGRVNLYRALTETNIPSVKMKNINFSDNDGYMQAGDTVSIRGDFLNYLAATSNLNVIIKSESPYVQLIDSVVNLGAIQTLSSKNNINNPFVIALSSNIPENHILAIRLEYSDINYNAFEYITCNVNKAYIDIDTNKIALTVASNSRLAYFDDNRKFGVGMKYNNGMSMIKAGGFIAGTHQDYVSDNIYNASGDGYDTDFTSEIFIRKIIPSLVSDYDVKCAFNDYQTLNSIDISVDMNAFAWDNIDDSKYIILEYIIKNKGNTDINGLYAGLFIDWNIGNPLRNRVSFDQNYKMSYAYSPLGGDYGGVKLLSSLAYNHYAVNFDGSDGSIKIEDGFNGTKKFFALTNTRHNAGFNATYGKDVAEILSYGPIDLLVDDTVCIAFAIIAANHLLDLQSSAINSQDKYSLYSGFNAIDCKSGLYLGQNFPNPFCGKTIIPVYSDKNENIELVLINNLGITIKSIYSGSISKSCTKFELSAEELDKGIYFISLKSNDINLYRKIIVF